MSKYSPKEYVPLHYYGQYERWRHHYKGERDAPVYVHRLLAVSEYGFDAVKNKEVHHKNGIKWDNRPENIELLTVEEHRQLEADKKYNGNWRNKELLEKLYWDQEKSMKEIADELDCTSPTICRWLKKHNIPTRKRKGGIRKE